MNPSSTLAAFWWRLLTFRASHEDYRSLNHRHLLAGLIVTWVVGMGRYWDDPKASLLQHLGAGSVAYVFLLSGLLWLICKPVAPRHVSYMNLLTFITLTSAPAALYAIPIEKWVTLPTANQVNLWFLVIVATWRVVLYFHYLFRACGMSGAQVFTCGLMPLSLIFISLLSLNLHHVVFNIMGGIREADKTSQDAAYGLLFTMSVFSFPVSIGCTLSWLIMVINNLRKHLQAKKREVADPGSQDLE